MNRWLDVHPTDWFYRDTLEMTRLKTDAAGTEVLNGMTYNAFETDMDRIVKRFITVEGQQEFLLPDYVYSVKNPIFVVVNGVEIIPEAIENGKITLTNPLSAGIEVVCVAYGSPAFRKEGCVDSPYESCANQHMPFADLKHKSNYVYNANFAIETCVILGVKLKKKIVNISAGDNHVLKIRNALQNERDKFVIHNGVLYVPYRFNGFPAEVGYNMATAAARKRIVETVIPESTCPRYNDRFFPSVRIRRGHFFGLLYNITLNFHNRFTDTVLAYTNSSQRFIKDEAELNNHWYRFAVKTLVNEKYLDGCYVFPLYADDSFEGEECLTRAEAVTYLCRFIDWITEKYR